MARHVFLFEGGEDLTTMGAVWFVSYCFYNNIDSKHLNWNKVSTFGNRASVYVRTKRYHRYWLERVLEMEDKNISKNTIKLNPAEIKEMAKQLLDKVYYKKENY